MFITRVLKKNKLQSIPVMIFALLVIFIAVISLYSIHEENKNIKENTRLKLISIADLKINQINSWRNERLIDGKAIFYNTAFIQEFKRICQNSSNKDSYQKLLPYLRQFFESNYYSIVITDNKFVPKINLNYEKNELNIFDRSLMKEALEGRRIILSDITMEDDTEDIHLNLIVPLIDGDSEAGVVLLKINPQYFLFPYINTWPVPSYSAESLIFERLADSVLFLNQLRYNKKAALRLKIPVTRTEVVAVQGALGLVGFREGVDYRGNSVLAFIKRIPGTKWMIVTKIDSEEVYASSRGKTTLIYTILIIISCFSGAVVFLYLKNQTKTQYSLLLENELEKEKVKNNLEASELKFASLFNSMKEGVAIHKVILNESAEPIDYVLIEINPAFEKNTGISIEKAKGALASKLYGAETAPYLKEFSDVALTGQQYEFETYFAPLNRHFRISVTSPGHLMFATIFLDISEIKESEQKLKNTINSLEQSNKELEQFAYVASHDLQEPLRMVSSFTQLLQKKYKNQLSEEADGYIHYAVDGAARMQILINDLLEYSRVTRKGKPFEQVDTFSVLGRAIANLRKKIEECHAIISNGELPSIIADEGQIARLLQNLIDNSIKYKGDDAPIIYIAASENENEWIFSVKDNGIGIDQEYYQRIFEIFERLHSSSKYPGTGIGLAICKKIVERHGGRIWVQANDDIGVTFYFTISKRQN